MKTIGLRGGIEFSQAPPDEVIDFLHNRSLAEFTTQPDRLHIANDGKTLILQVSNGCIHEYPVRKAFLFKLLKWFSFPIAQIPRLDIDTVTSILNDYLVAIRSGEVTITVEDGDALTITSRSYTKLADLEVLKICSLLGVDSVSRSDFFLRVYSEVKVKKEIVRGDECGFGYNVLNSETGFRSVSMFHYILRYICSNGAVIPVREKSDQRVHYGYVPGELEKWLEERVAVGEERRDHVIASLTGALEKKTSQRRAGLAGKINAVLGKGKGEFLLNRLPENASAFEVMNLITSEAQRFDIGRRLQLETIAGALLVHEGEAVV